MIENTVSYHGYQIEMHEILTTGDFREWHLRVSRKNELQFQLWCRLSGTEAAINNYSDEMIRTICLHQVHGIIDLQQYEVGTILKYEISNNSSSNVAQEISEDKVRFLLLEALYNIYQADPTGAVYEFIDVDGFCAIVGINKETYSFNASVLSGKGYIKTGPAKQFNINNGGIHITPDGIDFFENREAPSTKAENTLFANIKSRVDSELADLAPNAASNLLRVYSALTSADSDMSWKQIAYTCRDIIEDFTDALFDSFNVDQDKPPRNKTKNKLSLVLNAQIQRTSISKTLLSFVKAQTEYLLNYFNSLNDLLQKNVHAEQILKADAERCVIYTYLLIAEVFSLLKIGESE